jgi:hypothetical protein
MQFCAVATSVNLDVTRVEQGILTGIPPDFSRFGNNL